MVYMFKYPVPPYLRYDVGRTANAIAKYIREKVEAVGANGVVLGLSGGVDSSTVAALAVKALGTSRVYALILPERESELSDIRDAETVANVLSLDNVRYIDITNVVEALLKSVGESYDSAPKMPKANVKVRIRMVMLYYYANRDNLLVLGCGDRSEYLLGYFTKWGDGAADVYPILRLYKTQVRMMAEYLGIPEGIAWKPSSPGLWPGHRASDELGAEYDVIDKVLYHLIDLGLTPEETAERAEVPLATVISLKKRVEGSRHKRELPELPPGPIH